MKLKHFVILLLFISSLAFIHSDIFTVQGIESDTITSKFNKESLPFLKKYCLECHSTKIQKGELDLERFDSLTAIRKDLKPWQHLIEQIETGEMPPKGKPQPSAEERKAILAWVRTLLDSEAKSRSGDLGFVPLRRLSNAEYDATIRNLTSIDLKPTREFPADGAAGEGFTNAAESLTDISPALFTKYLTAAKDIADHAVLLPEGFRFSASKNRRDWTDEGTAKLRGFYNAFVPNNGGLPLQPYLLATVRHREELTNSKVEEVAKKLNLNAKYLGILWSTINDKTSSQPLDDIRAKWRVATEKDVPFLVADITAWQTALWKTSSVGNYIRTTGWGATTATGKEYEETLSRQYAFDPPVVKSIPIRLGIKPVAGQSEVVVHLAARETVSPGSIIWDRPRFEAKGKAPLLLRDYATFAPAFEVEYASAFANSARYLTAVWELANDPKANLDAVAKKYELNGTFLQQWIKVMAIPPHQKSNSTSTAPTISRIAAPLTLLDNKLPPNAQHPSINGWTKNGAELPVVLANASDKTVRIPGRISEWAVAVHPTPDEFVAIVWKSPIEGSVNVASRVTHSHPDCGNGVAWWLEHRSGNNAQLIGEGVLDLGQDSKPAGKSIKVAKGDLLVLAVDPRDANHFCDMTEVGLTISEEGTQKRIWDLGKDVSTNVQASNPHPDKQGNADTWSFSRGPAKKAGAPSKPTAPDIIPANSLLGRWRTAASTPDQQADAIKLAKQVALLLSGSRPANDKDADRILYDRLVTVEGPLFAGVDMTKIAKIQTKTLFGLPKERFTKPEGDSLKAPSNEVIEIRLPAALFVGHEFVVDAKVEGEIGQRFVRARAAATAPDSNTRWDSPVLAANDGPANKQFLAGHDAFRNAFPLFVCFPQVVPTDEVVTIKMFHREDEPLERLLLTDGQARELNQLWKEQRFISRQPVMEYDYLPQFMGFTTQDTPKPFQQFYVDRKPLFKKHADEFLQEEELAIPKQLDALIAFAEKAYRRPLQEKDKTGIRTTYDAIRKKGASHPEAFRGVLAQVLASPAFLFRIEAAPKGKDPGLINDWELATRLSYFLWSSSPDEELQKLAAAGQLCNPKVFAAQAQRMLKDPKARSLAIEFGTQWIHIRGFDDLKEKNEKLFPSFDAKLRNDIYEESILFFQDLFQSDRQVTAILDADYTFLNETLAKHYGIPGVTGPQWRKVEGVRKFGRGGILGLASVQAKQSGASRTSPTLRGNWVVETLLGEKLPRPPANVPVLPDVEGGTDNLSTRKMIERHISDASCATCHIRIDPFGFAFENFDPIGRWREKESGNLPIDSKAKLRDGTEFEGINGLRSYLLEKKKDVVIRLFCQRLLGYSLGRATFLPDTNLINEMVSELKSNDGRISSAIFTIIRSPQFLMIRGSDVALEER